MAALLPGGSIATIILSATCSSLFESFPISILCYGHEQLAFYILVDLKLSRVFQIFTDSRFGLIFRSPRATRGKMSSITVANKRNMLLINQSRLRYRFKELKFALIKLKCVNLTVIISEVPRSCRHWKSNLLSFIIIKKALPKNFRR